MPMTSLSAGFNKAVLDGFSADGLGFGVHSLGFRKEGAFA